MKKRILVLVIAACLALVAVMGVQAQNKLEIFSWWAGDESPALQALIDNTTRCTPASR